MNRSRTVSRAGSRPEAAAPSFPLGGPTAGGEAPPDGVPTAASCDNALQLGDVPRSVDYEGLTRQLSLFRINTSRKSRNFLIAFITNDFKPSGINTYVKKGQNPSRISTSKKQGGGEGCLPNLEISITRRRVCGANRRRGRGLRRAR